MLPGGRVQPTIVGQPEDRLAILADEINMLDKFTKLPPSHFSATPLEDDHGFLDHCHEVL